MKFGVIFSIFCGEHIVLGCEVDKLSKILIKILSSAEYIESDIQNMEDEE